jgi:hypothetical protein
MTVEVEVPPNASARVILPHSDTGPLKLGQEGTAGLILIKNTKSPILC